jgi:periplasmic protein TonB
MSSGEAWHSVSHSTAATPQTDLQERLAEIAGRAKNFTGAGGVAIALAAGENFATFVVTGTSLEIGAIVPIPTSFGGFRREKGNVLRCPDTDKEATIDMKACRAARIKSMLVVPVGDLNSVRAILAVFSSAAHAFTETHVAVLKTLAEVISNLLPEKEKVASVQPETKPEKKTDELLEHPFNPAFDPIPKAVKIGGGELSDFNQPPASTPIESPPSRATSTTGSIFAGGAVAPAKPIPHIPPRPAAAGSSAPPRAQGSVLDLASDPIAEGALVKPKKTRGKRESSRSLATTSITNVAVSSRRSFEFDFRKFYTAVVAVVALVAATWGLFEYVAARNARRVAESYIIPPPANSRTNKPMAAPARTIQPVPTQPAPVEPAAVQPTPMKTDVVGSATASALPARAPEPLAPAPQPIVQSRKSTASDATELKGQDIVVVSQPSPSALRTLEEESPPPVNVPTSSGMIGNLLNGSAPAPTPVLKRSQVVAAVVASKVAPVYPDQAKRYGLFGKVVISAKVTKTGTVGEVRPVTGNAILSDAAIRAVKKWRYKPATMDGRPVDSTVELTFEFNPQR